MNQKAGEKFRPSALLHGMHWGRTAASFFRLILTHKYTNVTLWSDSLRRSQFTCHHTD